MSDELTAAAERFARWDAENAAALARGSYVRAYDQLIPDVFLMARVWVADHPVGEPVPCPRCGGGYWDQCQCPECHGTGVTRPNPPPAAT